MILYANKLAHYFIVEVDMKRSDLTQLRNSAIFAAVISSFDNQLPQRCWNPGHLRLLGNTIRPEPQQR